MADYLRLILSEELGLQMMKLYDDSIDDDDDEFTEENRTDIREQLYQSEKMKALVWLAGAEFWLHYTNGINVYHDLYYPRHHCSTNISLPQKLLINFWITRLYDLESQGAGASD